MQSDGEDPEKRRGEGENVLIQKKPLLHRLTADPRLNVSMPTLRMFLKLLLIPLCYLALGTLSLICIV